MSGNGNGRPPEPPPIIGDSAAMQKAVSLLHRYAPTRLPILLVGATGTGKELFAQHVHAMSGRRGELVDIDCGALPRDMVEGLLLGYRRGAFTGAVEDRPGLIESAHEGTLLLDELRSLPEEGQRKLLRVLETGEVRRLGDTRKRDVDLRVVAAVQHDGNGHSGRGTLRQDLYERVAGVVICLPPLHRRPEDILPIARHFASLQGQCLASEAERRLESHTWPGNVRELRKVIARSGPMAVNGALTAAVIAEAIELGLTPEAAEPRRRKGVWLPAPTREDLIALCEANGWDTSRLAQALGFGRTTLFSRLREWGYSLSTLRDSSPSSLNVH